MSQRSRAERLKVSSACFEYSAVKFCLSWRLGVRVGIQRQCLGGFAFEADCLTPKSAKAREGLEPIVRQQHKPGLKRTGVAVPWTFFALQMAEKRRPKGE